MPLHLHSNEYKRLCNFIVVINKHSNSKKHVNYSNLKTFHQVVHVIIKILTSEREMPCYTRITCIE